MTDIKLPEFLQEKYFLLKTEIQSRLRDFASVPESAYFYELCYCLCTPQSKAENAMKVQNILLEIDFFNNPFDPSEILRQPENYIRFHNQKSLRLLKARKQWYEILEIIKSDIENTNKRMMIFEKVNGFGMKESSHYLRNIGYRDLAILDRHILKHLVNCGLYEQIPKISSPKQYLEVEKSFIEFAANINIPIDELDLLFWSYEAGSILK